MRVGIFQFSPVFGQKATNLDRIAQSLIQTPDLDVFVAPELATTGYTFLSKEEVEAVAEPIPEGPTSRRLVDLAKETETLIVLGMAERAQGRFYNSAAAFLPSGETVVYRKLHLFYEETLFFEPGDLGPVTFEYQGVIFGLMICFDWIFPEVARLLALHGAQVLLHLANLVLPWGQTGMWLRAIENRVFTVTANRVGVEDRGSRSYRFTGKSQIVSPEGDILIRAGEKNEGVFVAEIDPTLARDKAVNRYNDVFKDRRTDWYRLLKEP